MAVSLSHKFGQIIGDVLEGAMVPILYEVATKNNLFLDKKGKRNGRSGLKVTWKDKFGNDHDLDFVYEVGGSTDKKGYPVAFIESAWRRYTKHSRNKAQEIQGAIVPLQTTYENCCRFIGVILGGVFTDGALTQLRSLNFKVLYFPYEKIVKAFKSVGIDASFDEETPESEFCLVS